MPEVSIIVVAITVAVSLMTLGGGIYESSVVNPRWPKKPDMIRPGEGGLNRKHFWIPAHVALEGLLLVSLVVTWSFPVVRNCLWVALLSHVTMRCWSGFDFIPKALEFERSTSATYSASAAWSWTTRSLLRLPLDGVTCTAMLWALISLSGQLHEISSTDHAGDSAQAMEAGDIRD